MDCKLLLLALVLCLVQNYIEAFDDEEPVSYCSCLRRYKKEEDKYEEFLKDYKNQEVPFRTVLLEDLREMLKNMKMDNTCINSYVRSYSLGEFEDLVVGSCGITWLKNDYNPPWTRNTKMSREDVCLFITTKGEVAKSLAANNERRMKNCDGTKWFQETIYRPWENCTLTP